MSSPRPSPYILGARADWLLILGSPLLALGLVFGLATRWPPESIWAVVITFGAVGHHLPGFLRTYGDRELFARFRWRFLLAPPIFFALSYALAQRNLHGLLWISLMWSIWHGMMQHYGFMRIYDAKQRVPAKAFARADYWLTLTAFGACLVWSPEQGASVLDGLYVCGVSPLGPEAVERLRVLGLAGFAAALVGYTITSYRQRAQGISHAPLKLLLLGSTLSVVVIARVFTSNPFVGVAVFEVLHDVQYLAIVWAFEGRRRHSSGDQRSRVLSAITSSWPIYLLACLVYGALAWSLHTGGDDFAGRELLVAFLATSALLHYYYDGFIWKVRAVDTREHLELAADERRSPPTKDRSGLVQAGAFTVACVALIAVETRGQGTSSFDQAQALALVVPESPTARRNYANELLARGQFTEAIEQLEAAIARLPDDLALQLQLLDALLGARELERAREQLQVLMRMAPQTPGLHRRRGQLALALGDFKAASAALEFARAEMTPDAALLNDLGFAYLQLGELESAGPVFLEATQLAPRHAGAWLNLGIVQARSGALDVAINSLKHAIALNPRLPQAHNSLGGALMMAGRKAEAIRAFESALAVDPRFEPARHNLARARAGG